MIKSRADLFLLLKYLEPLPRGLHRSIKLEHDSRQDAANSVNPRVFCYATKGLVVINCTTALENLPRTARVGVLLHEVGHIVLDAFGSDLEEVRVDEWAMFDVPESGYAYKDVEYVSPWTNLPVIATALETVSGNFLGKLGWADERSINKVMRRSHRGNRS